MSISADRITVTSVDANQRRAPEESAVSFTRIDLVFCLITWLITPVLFLKLGQDSNFDLQNYHLYNTISFFESGFSRDTAPAGLQSYFNPLVSIPAYILHRLAADTTQRLLAGVALAGFQGLCGPLTYWIARFLLPVPRYKAALATLFGLSSPILLSQAGATFGDLTLCVLQLGAIALALHARASATRHHELWLALAWGLLGASFGIKFSAIFALPIMLMLSWQLIAVNAMRQRADRLGMARLTFRAITLPVLLGFLILAWPWLSRSWVDHGNPFYPLFSAVFGQSALLNFDNHTDDRFLERGLLAILTAPLDDLKALPMQRAELIYRDLRTSLWFYATLASLAVASVVRVRLRKRRYQPLAAVPDGIQAWIPLQLGCMVAYLIWIRTAGIARYALPLQALSGVLLWIAITVLLTPRRADLHEDLARQLLTTSRQRRVIWLFGLLTVLALKTTIVPSWGRVPFTQQWNVLYAFDAASNSVDTSTTIKSGLLFGDQQQIVLFAKPLAWLKQYAPQKSYHLMDNAKDLLKPATTGKLIGRIQANGGGFRAIDWLNRSFLKPQAILKAKHATPLGSTFATGDCTDFMTGIGRAIRVCDATFLTPEP